MAVEVMTAAAEEYKVVHIRRVGGRVETSTAPRRPLCVSSVKVDLLTLIKNVHHIGALRYFKPNLGREFFFFLYFS